MYKNVTAFLNQAFLLIFLNFFFRVYKNWQDTIKITKKKCKKALKRF